MEQSQSQNQSNVLNLSLSVDNSSNPKLEQQLRELALQDPAAHTRALAYLSTYLQETAPANK